MPDAPASWRERLAAAPLIAAVLDRWPRLVALSLAAAGLAVGASLALVAARGAPPLPELSLPRAAPPAGPPGPGPAGGDTGPGRRAPVAAGDQEAYVHVAGAVHRPGVYRVRAGGRVTDVVDAAGGPAPDADLDQLNLAARLADGERVYVPRRGEAPPGAAGAGGGAGSAGPAGAQAGLVDLNTATLEQLDALPGIGPATAQAIIDHRSALGRFRQVQELLEVRGIGEAKLAALRSRVRV